MRRRIAIVLTRAAFCSALLGITGCSGGNFFAGLFGPPDATGIAADASDALHKGDAESAEKLYTKALDMHTLAPLDNAKAFLGRGLAREKLAKHEDALADFTAAADANVLPPADAARAQYDRGVALDALGHMPLAIDAFTDAIKLKPDFAEAYTNRGNARLRLGNLDAARSDYRAALDAGISSPAYVWYGLGQIAQAEGDFASARDCYQKALGADPGYTLATAKLAELTKMNLPHRLSPPPLAPKQQANAGSTVLADASFAKDRDPLALRPAIGGNLPAPQADEIKPAGIKLSETRPGDVQVQLGAFRDKAMAATTWKRLTVKTGGLLDGLKPNIVAVDLPQRGRFWRLRTGVSDADAAASLCDRLNSEGVDCFAVNG